MAKTVALLITGVMILMAISAMTSSEGAAPNHILVGASSQEASQFNATTYFTGLTWISSSGQYGTWTEIMSDPNPDNTTFTYYPAEKTLSVNLSSDLWFNFSFNGLHHGFSLWVVNPHLPGNSNSFYGIATMTMGGYAIFNGNTPSSDNFVAMALFAWVYFPQEYMNNDPEYLANSTYVPSMNEYFVMSDIMVLLPHALTESQLTDLISALPYLGPIPTNEVQKTALNSPMGVNNFSF